MTSAIDPSVPVQGDPTTQSVRDNFGTASSEISDLQARVAVLEARAMVANVFQPADPAGTTSTTWVMMGLSVSFIPSPGNTRAIFTMCGQIGNTGSNAETDLTVVWGIGTPPNWGDPLTGTTAGLPVEILTARTNQVVPFSQTVLLNGLDDSGSTVYWIGVAVQVGSGTSMLTQLEFIAFGLIDAVGPSVVIQRPQD